MTETARPGAWWRGLSLRSRIALIAAVAVAVSVVGVSAVVFLAVRGELRHQLDAQLLADSRTVAERPGRWGTDPDPDHDHDHDVGPRVQILDDAGKPVLPAGENAMLPVTDAARAVVSGGSQRAFEEIHLAGGEYRMLTATAEHGGAVQVAASTDSVHQPLDRIGMILIAVSASGVAVAAGLGFLVARTGLAPVHRLTAAVEHVAATSDLSGRIAVHGRDEIARLADKFNGMLTALQSSRAAQRLLVEDAGHELRTPLTSLRTNIELLIRAESRAASGQGLPAEDRAALLRDLDIQTAELTQLVGELVDLAREEGSPEPVEQVDLADLVDRSVDRMRQRWPSTDVHVELTPVEVAGRPTSLERMVLNLVDNAAKWSPGNAPVWVRLRAVQEPDDGEHAQPWAELTVADSGPGVDPADLPRIFERFYRATAARAMPGSGLGLAIAAQAVQLHHGTITVERSDTAGALFRVRLPALSSVS